MKILLLILLICSVGQAGAQSIFEVAKNGHVVGYIAGGMHYGNAKMLIKETNSYEKLISLVDGVYIEADPHKKISDEHRPASKLHQLTCVCCRSPLRRVVEKQTLHRIDKQLCAKHQPRSIGLHN